MKFSVYLAVCRCSKPRFLIVCLLVSFPRRRIASAVPKSTAAGVRLPKLSWQRWSLTASTLATGKEHNRNLPACGPVQEAALPAFRYSAGRRT